MPRSPFASTFLAIAACLSLAACSEAVDDIFHSSGGNQGGAGGAGVTTGKTATSGTQGNTTSGPSATTGTGLDASSSGASMQTSVSSTDVVASSSSGPPPGLSCGNQSCNSSSNVCCYDSQAQPPQADCTNPDDCQSGGTNQFPTAISCQVPSQCSSGICCAMRYFNSDQLPYETTQCADSCPLPNRYLCDISNPDCPTYQDQMGNPVPTYCKPSTILPPGYYICSFTP